MIFRIRDTTTAWQIMEMEKDFPLRMTETISVFAYEASPEGLYIEFPHEPTKEFMAKWKMYLSEVD